MCSSHWKQNLYSQFISLADHFQIVYTYIWGGINFLKLIFLEGFYIVTWQLQILNLGEVYLSCFFFPMLYYCLRFEFGSRMLTNRFMSEVKKEKAKLKLPVIFVKEYKVAVLGLWFKKIYIYRKVFIRVIK